MKAQRGAALLAAMLTVTLVATMAATALWQQWRSVEVEAAERARVQSAWLLTGALDWARLILRQDAITGGADHLAEPWAVPLNEARLSTFLSMDTSSGNAASATELTEAAAPAPPATPRGEARDRRDRCKTARPMARRRATRRA